MNEPLLLQLLSAQNPKARAAAVRALDLWHTKITNTPALLTKAVADTHPQVRLEAVIALRNVKTAEAIRTALSVLEQPMDEFLDYALWQTVREGEPLWANRLKTEPGFFGNNRTTVFALKSVSSPDAVSQLARLYQNNQIPDDYWKDVLGSLAKFGTATDLTVLFNKTLAANNGDPKEVAAQLNALEEAARRKTKPGANLNRIADFINSNDDATALSAIRLIGLWQLNDLTDNLVSIARKEGKNERKAALGALATINTDQAQQLLMALTGPKNPADLRLAATAQLVSVNAPEAARIGADLLRTLPSQADVSELFGAFLTSKEGVKAMADELTSRKIPEDRAKTGRQILQRQVPYNQRNSEIVKLLAKALEASGGVLPVEKMPQELSIAEIGSLAKTVKETADPVKGELVFRKNAIACMTCHAIGGAGGRIGPDLSSLGTSSPAETIIRSILYPNQSIKEGYELQRVAKKDGSELLGYLVSNGTADVVLRDVAGQEISIPKSQINVIEKVPGSLMPSGLTAGLDKEEFANLVAFLSKMGESGQFRVPTARFVRRWNAVSATPELTKKIREEGVGYVVKTNAKVALQPIYGKVSGDLPLDELPIIDVTATKRYSIARFEIEVVSKGTVNLGLSTTNGVTAWVDQKPLKLTNSGLVADLPAGIHTITLALDRMVLKDGMINSQLQDAANASAQTRLVMGR